MLLLLLFRSVKLTYVCILVNCVLFAVAICETLLLICKFRRFLFIVVQKGSECQSLRFYVVYLNH